jgi:hypothetical protein
MAEEWFNAIILKAVLKLRRTMIDLKDILPLTEFNRNSKSHIRRLKESGKPEVLTVNGKNGSRRAKRRSLSGAS